MSSGIRKKLTESSCSFNFMHHHSIIPGKDAVSIHIFCINVFTYKGVTYMSNEKKSFWDTS